MKNKILAVLVVYERALETTGAWTELLASLNVDTERDFSLEHILLYDNSKEPTREPPASAQITYSHNPSNGGTAAAYVEATGLALSLGIDWVLLLDQDSILPANFFSQAHKALTAASSVAISALLPHVRHGRQLISPARITTLGSIVPLSLDENVRSRNCITAIASGAFIESKTLEKILPFPNELWLDYVDHWIFLQIMERNGNVAIFDATINHDLSVKTPESLSPFRIQSILSGEAFFIRNLGYAARIAFPLRLLKRFFYYVFINYKIAPTFIRWTLDQLKGSNRTD